MHKTIRHKTIEPTILYFGTPVALISTMNPDGSPNLAPMSSAWWLGWSCMLGLGQMGQTSDNLIRTRECVINLPSEDLASHVDRLALTTARNPVPEKNVSGAIAMNRINSVSRGSRRRRRRWLLRLV
jgi:flavin reductase (DIM6/NTAB) family NADH-FMN oxidoreductase RutF